MVCMSMCMKKTICFWTLDDLTKTALIIEMGDMRRIELWVSCILAAVLWFSVYAELLIQESCLLS